MGEKKLAVIFPGFGYHCDKPLLYYGKKLAREKGYEVLEIKYDIMSVYDSMKDDKDRDAKIFKMATDEAMERFSEVKLPEYEKFLFIGKSFGTIVAGYCDNELKLNARQIVFTPVPETFKQLKKGCGIVFHGTSDPLCDNEIARKKCKELELELVEVEGANHSLEILKVDDDIRTMGKVMERVVKEM